MNPLPPKPLIAAIDLCRAFPRRCLLLALAVGLAVCSWPGGARAESMKPTKIVFLGDSITGRSDLVHYLKFSHIVDCMIEARWGAGKAVVVNRGIGGNTTTDVLKRFQTDVLDEHPDLVVLLISGNDANLKTPQEVTRANLKEIVTRLHGVGSKVLLLQYHMLPNPQNPEKAWVHLPANNGLIAEVAAETGCPVLNMAPLMQAALGTHAVTELVNEADGVHLNSGGELVYARAVFAKLLELGWLGK